MKPTVPTNLQPPSLQLAEALAFHARGQLREAEARYARILVGEPKNILARYQLALARLQRGEFETGVAAMKQVLKIAPDHAQAHFDLAQALSLQGKHAQALSHFQRAAGLCPDAAETQFYLGMTLCSLRRHEEALPHLERAIALRPALAEAHHNLGGALLELGRSEEAIAHFEQALALRPAFPEAMNGLGNALFRLQRYQDGIEQYKRAIFLQPDFAEAYGGWGEALLRLGEHPAARSCFQKALELRPDDARFMALLGGELNACGQHGEALACLERAQKLNPEAVHDKLGPVLFLWGRYTEGREHLERAIALSGDALWLWSGLLFNLHYVPGMAAAELARLHRACGEKIEMPLKAAQRPHANAPDPERLLRVGFVSGDLRRHPVGYFMADLLAALDRKRIQLYAYANQTRQDELTAKIRPLFEYWRDVLYLSDEALAEQIRADAIDILVDLSGHTQNGRLPMFALKPAPVQVTYLGYFDTTGLTSMDYILGNRWLLPADEARLYVEKPWHLPDAHLCFTPPDSNIAVESLPALQRGSVTFGCFNQIEKVNTAVIACWSRLLHAVPGSRLYLKSKPLDDPALAKHFRALFAAQGIGEDRLQLEGYSPHREYLECYNQVDIALDPFPYNGGTTSVEAMWMGVPVLTLKGDHYASHMGESILYAVDLSEWIAENEAEYVARAAAFASDFSSLAILRDGLRGRLLASPIGDASRFARNLENALQEMWRKWCEQQV